MFTYVKYKQYTADVTAVWNVDRHWLYIMAENTCVVYMVDLLIVFVLDP